MLIERRRWKKKENSWGADEIKIRKEKILGVIKSRIRGKGENKIKRGVTKTARNEAKGIRR